MDGRANADIGRAATEVRELWLAGYACVPLTPFSIKDYERRDDGPLPPFGFGMAYASWSGEIRPVLLLLLLLLILIFLPRD